MAIETKLYTTAEIALLLHCSQRTVRRYCEQHELGRKPATDWLLTDEDLSQLRQLRENNRRRW